MDESALKKIVQEFEIPPVDENAKKRAVNLALAEFKAHQQQKSQKSSQGTSILSRLIGRSTPERGRDDMKFGKKGWVFAGTGTALALVLVAGLNMQGGQVHNAGEPASSSGQFSNIAYNISQPKSVLSEVYEMFGGSDEKSAALPPPSEVSAPPGTAEASPAYVQAVEEANEADMEMAEMAKLEKALRSGESSIPVPVETPTDRLQLPQEFRTEGERSNAPMADEFASGRAKGDDGMVVAELKKNEDQGKTAPSQAPAKEKALRRDLSDKDSSAMASPGVSLPGVVSSSEATTIYPEPYPYPQPIPVPISPPMDYVQPYYQEQGRDRFPEYKPNSFKLAQEEPVSTFSSDVDTASYSFVRRELNSGRLPPAQSVRVEEMVNYFDYNYAVPESKEEPFQPTVTIVDSPWAQGRKLMHIGIKGYEITGEKPRSNLVFLLDVSGSMDAPDKLPLLKNSMKLLLDSLQPDDTVSIVVYAGSSGTVLAPTKVSDRSTIYSALDNLQAGGSTAGAAGIELAYQLAEQNFNKEAVNRVILATDGDFNVGITNRDQLKDYVSKKRETGIFLSVLGFGQGNYNDDLMQALAQNGNGTAAYIDSLNEARKVLLDEASSTLFPIAKDVKFQIEFNTAQIAEYRLIGYETRHLNREDFNNDKVDAGDMGAGHTVTAIYEFVPVGSASARTVDDLRYAAETPKQAPIAETVSDSPFASEYAFLKIRYKLPNEDRSRLITRPVTMQDQLTLQKVECGPADSCPASASDDTRFATAVAAFGQILRGEVNMVDYKIDDIIALAQDGKGADEFGYRAEFINLVRLAKTFENR
ncbi:MAG: VWA domain-containing protein [Alphaproteobacteria bacterium]